MQPTSALLSRAARKLRLTTKSARKGFYKGTGAAGIGDWIPGRWAVYRANYDKVRTYVRPMALEDSPLTPFVHKAVKTKAMRPMTGKEWLEAVKANGNEILGQRPERLDYLEELE